MSTFVVVSGLPASGKTTLAAALATELAAPHLDKDVFLEALFDVAGRIDSESRQKLSRLADEEFQSQALRQSLAVLSSWWRHPHSIHESGTPTAWLHGPGQSIVEVYCCCSTQVALRRFVERRRHAGHLDANRNEQELTSQFAESERLGPVISRTAIQCNTSERISAASFTSLVHEVRRRVYNTNAA